MRTQHLVAGLCVVSGLAAGSPAWAQVDPLLFLKRTAPTVIVALELSSRMQRDPHDVYHDPVIFPRTGEPFEAALGVSDATVEQAYRRRYVALEWGAGGDALRARARAIEVVGDRDPAWPQFDAATRLGRARVALQRVVETNTPSVRFGLLTTRQSGARLDLAEWPSIQAAVPGVDQPTDTGVPGQWRAGIPVVDGPGAGAAHAGPVVAPDAPDSNSSLRRLLARRPGSPGALLPAGLDTDRAADAPIALLLDDLHAEALRLAARDSTCCNTVAVLVVAGSDPSQSAEALRERAAALLGVLGRRVPLYVVALAPAIVDTVPLQQAALVSGGRYFEIPAHTIDRVPPEDPVPEIVAALNAAVQHGFATFADFNTAPSASAPYGPRSFFPTAAPVVGTVNLENAVDAGGRRLPDTRVSGPHGELLPQRSNVMVTAGLEVPGLVGRVSAFRVYRPVADARQVTGYRFVNDGTRLWAASTPSPDRRNLFTVLPGGEMVPLRSSSAALLAPYLRVRDPAALIEAIRALPLGAITNSTPALLEPPSMPWADPAYQAFAAAHAQRRALLFVGADDGMMHALDARTGVEVWAVVPFNLLPQLRRLLEGGPVDAFPFMVGGSPRLADVSVLGNWRTFLVFGEGPGGTFYQAFDATLEGIEDNVPDDADNLSSLLAWFATPSRIPAVWSFPRYDLFDPSLGPAGDLRASATESEKSVGESWSTPVTGRAGGAEGRFVVVVGSGRLARTAEEQPQRGGTRGGTRLYMLDAATGSLLDSRDVGSDGVAEDQDECPPAGCARLKNALQADPLGTGPPDTGAIDRVYQGDLDGRLWRFDLAAGPGPPGFAGPPRLLLDSGSDQPIFGSVAVVAGSAGQAYVFLATGSDLVPGAGGGRRLIGLMDGSGGASRQFERRLRSAATDGVDEGAAGAPTVAGGVVFFTTSSGRPGSGCESPETRLYALTVSGGVAYDANGDGRRDDREDVIVASVRAGRATGPVVADRHVFVATGDRLQVFGDPEGYDAGPGFLGLRIVSWRERR